MSWLFVGVIVLLSHHLFA